jgi:hypothetical protein
MDFPRLVYKCPGQWQCHGGTYTSAAVENETELKASLAAGWFASLEEAINGESASVEDSDDDAPPTRAELEEKARELGIKFDGRTSDKKLLANISAALGE